MKRVRSIESLTFTIKQNPELIKKLNLVAPYQYRTVHDVARMILLEKLNELITQYGIENYEDSAQPTVG